MISLWSQHLIDKKPIKDSVTHIAPMCLLCTLATLVDNNPARHVALKAGAPGMAADILDLFWVGI